MAPTIKVTYFPSTGRAEPTRLALTAGGIVFEDERLDAKAVEALKQEDGKVPFKSVPTMTVDGEVYAESNAMLRFAGKVGGFYPKCDKAALKVDMVIDALESVISAVFADSTEDGRKKFVDETIPRYFGPIDAIFGQQKGPFMLGEELSIADFKVACMIEDLTSGKVDHISKECFDKYTHLKASTKSVFSNEKIKAYKTKA